MVEDFLVGLNSYGDDTLLNGTLEGVGRSWGNVSVVLNGNVTGGEGGIARRSITLSSGVSIRVGGLSVLRVGLEVLESLVLPASIATEAGLVAGDELLLRKAQEIAGGSEVSVLDGSSGRESPARTTVSLVLDGVDTTLGSPVPSTVGRGGEVLDVLLGGLTTGVTEELLELSLGPGGEHVVADGEGVLGVGVELSEGFVLGGKKSKSVFVLLLGGIGDTVLVDVGGEGRFEGTEIFTDLVLDAEDGSSVAKEVHF